MGELIKNLSESEIKEILYKELPRLIKEHPEVKGFIKRVLERCPYKEVSESRFEKLLEEIKSMREESDRKWRENQEEIKRLREESEKRWRDTQEEIKRLHRLYDTRIGALGARWGLQAESTFREAIKGILEESFPVKVERYLVMDNEGKVFGRPEQVELDLIIKDSEVIVGEIKSSMSKSDIYAFYRKVKFYEEKEEKKVSRKIIISPMIDPRAKKVAEELGIEIYTYPEYITTL